MKKEVASVVRCEDGAMNWGFSNEEAVSNIAKAGFKKVFMSFQNEHLGGGYRKYLKLIRDAGLEVNFVHLGYRVNSGIATIWEEGEAGDELVRDYLKDLEIVAKDGIKMVCMHVTKSNKKSPMSEIGLSRWRKIVKKAEELGIVVTLENTVWKGYLEFILDNIKSDNLAVCYDSGHAYFHFQDDYNFDKFKGKIACLHLHDNDGTADQHLLPMDGSIDWNGLLQKLKKTNFCGDFTSEAVRHENYKNLTPLQFFKEQKNRLEKLQDEYCDL